jgi:hypothetical protein
MNLNELKSKLYNANVPDRWYSLDEGEKPDAVIVYNNYSKWECYYLDEKGDKRDFRLFRSDQEAYDYLWGKMERQLAVFRISPRKEEEGE